MKTLFKKLRKGFTIVELVIVIAVIAILAAVLIPTLANVIDSANESVDMQTVKNLNTIVSAYDTVGDIETVNDALDGALENGYSVSALTPTSEGNIIVYDASSNRFALLSDDYSEVIYKDSATTKEDASDWQDYTTWIFVKTSDVTATNNGTYDLTDYTNNSYILVGDEWNNANVTVSAGISVYDYTGTVTLNTVNVNQSTQTSTKANANSSNKSAIVKTTTANSGNNSLVVNVKATNLSCNVDDYVIENYSSISVSTAIVGCQFNEHGSAKIYDTTKIGSGKVTNYNAEINSEEITIYYPEGKSVSDVFTDNTSKVDYTVLTSIAATEVTIAAEIDEEMGTTTISISVTVGTTTTTYTGSIESSGTATLELGTEKYPYLIDSVSEWIEKLADEGTSKSGKAYGGYYWEVTANLDFNEVETVRQISSTVTVPSYCVYYFKGNIDFGGNTITMENKIDYSKYYSTLIHYVYGSSTLSNLNLVLADNDRGLVERAFLEDGNVTLSNITTSGLYKMDTNNVAPFIDRVYGYGNDYVLTYENCTNEATITATGDTSASVFLGKVVNSGNYSYATLVFDTCINKGTLILATTNGYVSMLIANGATFTYESLDNITVKNCVNYGKIYGNNSNGNSNLLCGGGQTKASISAIKEWVEANKANLYNGEGGECEDKTFSTISVSEDGNFNLSSLTTTETATSYSISFSFRVNIYDSENKEELLTHGAYTIILSVSSLSNTKLPAYGWISESDVTTDYTTGTIEIGGTTLKTATTGDTTYYVFEESNVLGVAGWLTSTEGYVALSEASLTIYEYIGSSVGNIYTYTYTN